MTTARTSPGIRAGQPLHFSCLALLLSLTWVSWNYAGRPCAVAFWAAIAIPIAHQVFVWLAWRIELRSSTVSRTMGLQSYLVIFFVLLAGRPVSVLVLAWMDAGSLGLPMLPRVIMTTAFGLASIYLGYSLKRYFGFERAAGADHFDSRYRDMPIVREGIFRFTSNGMYVYGFLMLWAIAIGFNSTAALIVTAFNHAYIWVHFYATEKPDMNYLYGSH
jgi:hypothetical protein